MKPANENPEIRMLVYLPILAGVILFALCLPVVLPPWVFIGLILGMIVIRAKPGDFWYEVKNAWYRVKNGWYWVKNTCQRVKAHIACIPPKQQILFVGLNLALGCAWYFQFLNTIALIACCLFLLPLLYPKLSDPFSPCAVCDATVRWPHLRWRRHGKFIIVCTDCQRQLLGDSRHSG